MILRTSLGGFRFGLLVAIGLTGAACSSSSGGEKQGGASSGGSDGEAGAGGSQGGSGGAPPECVNPTPLSGPPGQAELTGGFVQCDNFPRLRRPTTGKCWSTVGILDGLGAGGASTGGVAGDAGAAGGKAGWTCASGGADGAGGSGSVDAGGENDGAGGCADPVPPPECTRDSDCTAKPHGFCKPPEMAPGGFVRGVVHCEYGCVEDSECESGRICLCGSPVGECVQAECATDADCEGGQPCRATRVTADPCFGSDPVFRCEPACRTTDDCPTDSNRYTCEASGDCRTTAVCGRPFLIDGETRLAPSTERADWGASITPDTRALSPEERRRLAAHYTEIGLMEHASVAAFARFTLELLSLGAAPELVQAATEALADETRHARVCFGLASAYGGVKVGPGPLSVDRALVATSLAELVETAFREACIGETLAAVEVAEAAARATDAVIASALAGIAEDEKRHAALGFRFVRWALGTLSAADRRALEGRLASVLASEQALPARPTSFDAAPALVAHGLLPVDVRSEIREVALREVVVPCLHAILGGPGAALAA